MLYFSLHVLISNYYAGWWITQRLCCINTKCAVCDYAHTFSHIHSCCLVLLVNGRLWWLNGKMQMTVCTSSHRLSASVCGQQFCRRLFISFLLFHWPLWQIFILDVCMPVWGPSRELRGIKLIKWVFTGLSESITSVFLWRLILNCCNDQDAGGRFWLLFFLLLFQGFFGGEDQLLQCYKVNMQAFAASFKWIQRSVLLRAAWNWIILCCWYQTDKGPTFRWLSHSDKCSCLHTISMELLWRELRQGNRAVMTALVSCILS